MYIIFIHCINNDDDRWVREWWKTTPNSNKFIKNKKKLQSKKIKHSKGNSDRKQGYKKTSQKPKFQLSNKDKHAQNELPNLKIANSNHWHQQIK